ncbi:unnamed protein product, partial [Timema podura]|nr:unnamed protein product [Timema podura]
DTDIYTALSVNHIINGKVTQTLSYQQLPEWDGCFQKGEFPGLIPLINSYLSGMDVDADTHCTIQQYLKLIQRRAAGDLHTTASWIRDFVQTHPDYKQDSVVSDLINYDLLSRIHGVQSGDVSCPELLGTSLKSKTQENIPAAMEKAESH